ncbi:CDP-alcohol phosphatidyltransferase family protein [Fodinicola acaciae]|uniref:CDP-alcohol phosphatidyltransferase family protein n=1 Tax=Fodinicola acaciae TaxID=2681555 RepID=UPI0013D69B53|nr:CDP-alcohol phosphatidyltransferase family protein [Fodinicola acaciae]
MRPPFPDFDGYLDRWAPPHGGWRPSGVFPLGWFRVTYALALPLARFGVHPHVVTAFGLLLTAGVPLLALTKAAILVVPLLVCCGLADSVDGAVAVLTGRASGFGAVLDSLCDRVGEALFLVALVVAGAPPWLAAPAALVAFLLEYVRARAAAVGMTGMGIVTVFERPSRILVVAFTFVAVGGLRLTVHDGLSGVAATAGVALWLALALAGLGQILHTVRSALADR